MNGAGRCPCDDSRNPCLSCKSGEEGSPGTLYGVRRGGLVNTRYVPDAVRDPGVAYQYSGYMRSGYDTGRNR